MKILQLWSIRGTFWSEANKPSEIEDQKSVLRTEEDASAIKEVIALDPLLVKSGWMKMSSVRRMIGLLPLVHSSLAFQVVSVLDRLLDPDPLPSSEYGLQLLGTP